MSMSDTHPTLGGALVVSTPPTPAITRELRTHLEFAVCLLLLWLTLPMIVTAAAMAAGSPALMAVAMLDAEATSVSISRLPALYELSLLGLAGVVLVSFVARVALIPGCATGDFHRDISGRASVRVGVIVALTNFVALTFYTAAIVEAWIFPLLTFSICQVVGVYVERLRRADDLRW